MVSRAPIEIWSEILEEVIDVPEFFSGEPLEPYRAESWIRFRHEPHYWRSERWRNACRRVHSSWNRILSQDIYRHRFVNINDIRDGRLSPTNLSWRMVLRIDLGLSGGPDATMVKAMEQGTSDGGSKVRWRLRIVDGLNTANSDFRDTLRKLTSVQGISSRRWNTLEEYGGSSLLFIQIDSTTIPPSLAPPTYPNLSSLILSTYSEPPSIQEWKLPSLAHLQVSSWPSGITPELFLAQLVRMLEALGRNLRTLHIDYTMTSDTLPQSIWRLVPKLTRIRLNCFWTHPPPKDHPLSMVCLHSGTISSRLSVENYERMPGWPALGRLAQFSRDKHYEDAEGWRARHVRVCTTQLWETVFYWNSTDHPWLELSDMYDNVGWTFTDYSGLTFSGFLVLLLKDRRDAKRRRTPRWDSLGWHYYLSGGWKAQRVENVGEETDRYLLQRSTRRFEHF